MGPAGIAVPHALHGEAALQQRQIEGCAVKGAQHAAFVHILRHAPQQGRLLIVIPHQVLAQQKAVRGKRARAHQKRHRARPVGQARGFRIQKADILPAAVRQFQALHQGQAFARDAVRKRKPVQRGQPFPDHAFRRRPRLRPGFGRRRGLQLFPQ